MRLANKEITATLFKQLKYVDVLKNEITVYHHHLIVFRLAVEKLK